MSRPSLPAKELHSEPLLLRLKPATFDRLMECAKKRDIPPAVLGREALLRGIAEIAQELATRHAA
jgi:hypothetical protein